MFGIGATEMVIICIVLLIAVGPTKLPKLIKAGVSGYREFRRATRELRASTGIDEILRDEDLKELRNPLKVPAAKKPSGKLSPKKRGLSYSERVEENPPEGVDLAEIRRVESQPSQVEREAIRARKDASAADGEAIRRAKGSAAAARFPEAEERNRAEEVADDAERDSEEPGGATD